MTIQNIVMLLTGMTSALMAGLFFFWSITIMPGMQKLNDLHYVEAMQNFNREILHPAFYIIFIGSVILLPVATYLEWRHGVSEKFWLLLSATLIYLGGVILVTALGNVPLNNELEIFNIKKSAPEAFKAVRDNFESAWNRLNWIRTFSSFASLLLVLIAIVKK